MVGVVAVVGVPGGVPPSKLCDVVVVGVGVGVVVIGPVNGPIGVVLSILAPLLANVSSELPLNVEPTPAGVSPTNPLSPLIPPSVRPIPASSRLPANGPSMQLEMLVRTVRIMPLPLLWSAITMNGTSPRPLRLWY